MSSYICVYCRKRWIYLLCDDNTARIIKGHIGRSKRFKISGIIEVAGQKYKILGIGWRSFNKPKRLKHITFPDSIEYVDEDEFTFLPKLQTVHIGKGLEDLFDWHFRRSGRQVQIFIDKDNPYIKLSGNFILTGDGKTVLRTNKRCSRYIIPEGVETLCACSMWENEMLEEVTFPSTLKVIGDNGLSNNPKIKKMIFPEGFETFDEQGLVNNIGLKYLDLPSTLKRLAESLCGCIALKYLIIRTNHVFDEQNLYLDDIPSYCLVVVPDDIVEDYKRHPVWGKFIIKSLSSIS